MKENLFLTDPTLYHWIDRGMRKTKNINLLAKASRKPGNDLPKHHKNHRVLGPSIKDRADQITTSKHFGYWK